MSVQIPLNYWWYGAISFFLCYLIHLLLWRQNPPRRDILGLLLVLWLLPAGGIISFIAGRGFAMSYLPPILTHYLLSTNYLAIYPAFQATSPTLKLLTFLSEHPSGQSEIEILQVLAKPQLVTDRLQDLSRGKLIGVNGTEICLKPLGTLLAEIFLRYRRFLGLPEGKG